MQRTRTQPSEGVFTISAALCYLSSLVPSVASFQVPQFLMDQYRYDEGGDGSDGGASKPYNIVCTQPRRISAIGKEGATPTTVFDQCYRCSESMLEHITRSFRGGISRLWHVRVWCHLDMLGGIL